MNRPPVVPPTLPASWLACFKQPSQIGYYETYIVIRKMDEGSSDKFRVHSASYQADGDEENHKWSYHHGDYVQTWEAAVRRFIERANLTSYQTAAKGNAG